MINSSNNHKGQTYLLLILLFVLLLVGCSSTTESKPPPPASAQAIAAGDADRGRNLFMGYAHFQNDGPPCMGCHNVGNNGLLGGGAMGPDLTNVSKRLSQEEIASILSNNGPKISPVMQPIFTEHPLTESEQADLIAFLSASVGQPEPNKEILVMSISLVGLFAAIGLIGFVYHRRLRGVRRPLLRKAQAVK